ncbi:MAG: nucleoside deaminase [Candidatus Dormibacteria bacterium]
MLGESLASADLFWSGLAAAWQEAFRQAWEAFRIGNIPVGACATSADGAIVHAARNRVSDQEGPTGEVYGSTLAHAEINGLARLRFDLLKDLVLTTTLEPCLQCSAATRLGPISTVRYAGADPLWVGCHDFSPLSAREAARPKIEMAGPRIDELGLFGTLISRLWVHRPKVVDYLRLSGETRSLALAQKLAEWGRVPMLAGMEVAEAFAYLWPDLEVISHPPGRQESGGGSARGPAAR